MNRQACGVSLGVLLALSALISACANSPTERTSPPIKMLSYPKDPFWWSDKVKIKDLHDKGHDGDGRTVAVLDSGFSAKPQDLNPSRIDSRKSEYCPPGIPPTNVEDINGHGTAMAVIALGDQRNTTNGRATGGIATKAMLLPIKIVCGDSTADSVTQGVDAAIAANVDVILLALGGWPSDLNKSNETVDAYLLKAVPAHPDILFVVASVWDDTTYKRPDWTKKDNVILVAATMLVAPSTPGPPIEVFYSDERSGDIWAPGRDVETAFIDPPALPDFGDPKYSGTYGDYLMQGASPAAAIVAGCAAALKKDKEQAKDLKARLTNANFADPMPNGKRRINCANAPQ
jgi:subtilisin family serine protease